MIKGCEGLNIDSILLRIREERIKEFNGDSYESGRKSWTIADYQLPNLKYAIISQIGEDTVKEVYNIEEWEESDETPGKRMFKGYRNIELEKLFVGKPINKCYRKRGMKGGRFYASSQNLIENI